MYSSDAEFNKSGIYSINEFNMAAHWKYKFRNVLNTNFLYILLMSAFFFLLFFSFNTAQVRKTILFRKYGYILVE